MMTESAAQLEQEKNKAEQFPEIAKLCEYIDLDIETIAERILERLELLRERTDVLDFARESIDVAREVFDYYEEHKVDKAFTPEEIMTVEAGTLFSDIGKSGPADATPDEQRLIADIYRVNNVPFKELKTMTVADFFARYYPDNAEGMHAQFQDMGLNSSMTMRNFYNLHAYWTYGIVRGDGVPPEAVAAAATHHLVDGVNPEGIVGERGEFTRDFGGNDGFGRAEKLVILLDKFDALVTRGGKPEEEALDVLQHIIETKEIAKGDEEFEELLEDLRAIVETRQATQ